jgi:hypothetical protein
MVKKRHATMPTKRRPGHPRPDKNEKIRDRTMLEYMPSADFLWA